MTKTKKNEKSIKQKVFKTRKEALFWLREQGYKLSHGKFYGDSRKGLLVLQKNGSVKEQHLMEYVTRTNVPQYGKTNKKVNALDDLEIKIKKAKLEGLELTNESKKRKNEVEEGKLILREDKEMEVIAAISLFYTYLRHEFKKTFPYEDHDRFRIMMDNVLNGIVKNNGYYEVLFEEE